MLLRNLLLLPLASLLLYAQTALTAEQFRGDLQYIVNELPHLHPNLFFDTPAAEFEAAAQRLEADIPNLSIVDFYTRLGTLVAMAHDAHTHLYLTSAPDLGFLGLPIEFGWLADGVFVTAISRDRAALNRARLVDINGVPLDEVLHRLEALIPHENLYWFRYVAPSYLANQGVLRGLGITPASAAVRYGLQTESGEQIAVELTASSPAAQRAIDTGGYRSPVFTRADLNYWSEYWPASKALYIRYLKCAEMAGRPFLQFTRDTLALLDANPVETLIFDLRGNGGGSSDLILPLFVGVGQRIAALNANPRFRLYALSDGGTFSSGELAVSDLKAPEIPQNLPPEIAALIPADVKPLRAIQVGGPTGSKPGHYGDVKNLSLPQSRLMGQYSTRWVDRDPWLPERDSIYPEIPVTVRSLDYFARHDAILAAALAHAEALPSPPAGDTTVVNSASFRSEQGVAPGSFASAFGAFPAGELGATVNGKPVRMIASTPNQLVFLVSSDTAVGPATLEVTQAGQVVSRGQFQVTTAGPGLFVARLDDRSQPGAILNQDNSPNSLAAPAARRSVVQIFATGYGPLDSSGSAQVGVWIANLPAEVLYSGPAPGIPGLWQINARVPDDAAVTGQVPVFVAAHGLVSNGVTIAVE